MPPSFPFSAIVGQHEMKLALLVAAVDPGIRGVMVFGDRGTGKSTAVRAMPGVLPLDDGGDRVPLRLRPGRSLRGMRRASRARASGCAR